MIYVFWDGVRRGGMEEEAERGEVGNTNIVCQM
jgi:hypothetical protein